MELTLIKERLNDDVITVILGYLPNKQQVLDEKHKTTFKLYKSIINETRNSVRCFTEGKIYMNWFRGGWMSGNMIDENDTPRLLFFKVERKTEYYLTLRLLYDKNYVITQTLDDLVESAYTKKKRLYINANRDNGEHWLYISMNNHAYNIYADSCYEYDKVSHAKYRYKYSNDLELLYGLAEGKWTGARTRLREGVIA